MKNLITFLILISMPFCLFAIDIKEGRIHKSFISEEFLEGIWVGSWDDKTPVYFEFKKRDKPNKNKTLLISICRWSDNVAAGFNGWSGPNPVNIVDGEVLLANAFLESVPGQPGVILATELTGKMRATALYKSNPADVRKYKGKWKELIKKLRADRRAITKKDSTAPLLIFGYFYSIQTLEDQKESGVIGINCTGLMPGKPASKAGMKPGDVVVRINGKKVFNRTNLIFSYRHEKGKTPIPVEVWRNKKIVILKITPTKRLPATVRK